MDRTIMGANWYVDTLNQRLRIESLQCPSLKKAMDKFVPGGGFFALDMPNEIDPLEAPFSLRGRHEDVRSLFGREPGDWTNFFYYENLRDIVKGKNIGRVVQIRGLVNEVEQGEVKGKKGEPDKYKVGTVVRYRDVVDGKLIHMFDVFSNRLVINGIDYTAEHNRLIAA